MAQRYEYDTPKVKVEQPATRLCRYEVKAGDEGWLYYDDTATLARQGKLLSTFFPAGVFQEFGKQTPARCIAVDRKQLKGVFLRPYLSGAPRVVSGEVQAFGQAWTNTLDAQWSWNNLAFHPNLPDYWSFRRSDDGLFVECSQQHLFPIGTTQAEIDAGTASPLVSRLGFNGHDLGDNAHTGLCPNGFFAAGVRRQALSDEVMKLFQETDVYSELMYTNIYFGNLRWCLRLPLNGKPTLMENVMAVPLPPGWGYDYPAQWVPRKWTEGSLEKINPQKAAEEGLTYRIGAIGNCVCVSEGGFDDDFPYYCLDDDGGRFHDMFEGPRLDVIPAGPITIENWPGVCTSWLDLMELPEGALLYRGPRKVKSYSIGRQGFAPFYKPGTAVEHVDGCEVGQWAVSAQVPSYPDYMYYVTPIIRGVYPSAAYAAEESIPASVPRTCCTPLFEAASLWQETEVTDNGAETWSELSNAVVDLNMKVEHGSSKAQHHELRLDNRGVTNPVPAGVTAPAEGYVPTGKLSPGATVKISAGWVMKQFASAEATAWTPVEALVQQGQFWVAQPSRDSREGTFDLIDILGLLKLYKWDLEDFNVRGWPVTGFAMWFMNYLGIGNAWLDFEDLGDAAKVSDDNDRGAFELGTDGLTILAETFRRFGQNATVWYDGQDNKIKSGCPYCRTKRTEANYASHNDNGWLSSGCLAADAARVAGGVDLVAVENPKDASAGNKGSLYIAESMHCVIESLSEGQYANVIVVEGRSEGEEGQPIIARWENAAALRYAGAGEPPESYVRWPVTHIEKDSSLTTTAAVEARKVELAQKMGGWPRAITARLPFLSPVKPGMVMKVEGGKPMGVHNKKFRITQVAHDLSSHRTRLEAREMAAGGSVDD